MAARIYPTLGDALADPTSNISRRLAEWEKEKAKIRAAAARLQDQGMTGEQAWLEVMKLVRPMSAADAGN